MTSTGTFKGFQDGSRNSSKVLKPPGGGSSDIFGSGSEVDSPRRAKQNYNHSQLGSSFFGDQPQQPQQQQQQQQQQSASNGSNALGNDSHERLFGLPEAPPPSTPNSKYHMRSNILLNDVCVQPNLPASLISNGSDDHLASSDGYNDVMDGNPVTGTGYEPHAINSIIQQNGNGIGDTPSIGSDKSSTDSSPSAGSVTRMKNRVPPGGYSSGLW